jgi:ribosomal protein S18 acetylase RimI-like enzyme
MANQFFSFHPSAHRELVAKATAESTLDLQWAHIGKKQLGAVMLSRATAHLGLFNLCVSANHRHRGIGTQMVRAVLSIGEQERRAVLLQCDAKLCQWYESFGFRKTAKVEVFALRKN